MNFTFTFRLYKTIEHMINTIEYQLYPKFDILLDFHTVEKILTEPSSLRSGESPIHHIVQRQSMFSICLSTCNLEIAQMVSFSLSQRDEILGVSFYPKKAPDIAFSEIMHAQIKYAFFLAALVFRMGEFKSKPF